MTTCKLWLYRKEIEINETYDVILSKIGKFIPKDNKQMCLSAKIFFIKTISFFAVNICCIFHNLLFGL